MAVDAGVFTARDAVRPRAALRDQYRTREALLQSQGARVRGGRVPLRRQDQQRRHVPRPGAYVDRPLPRRLPVRARQVHPDIGPGLERRPPRQRGVVPIPHRPVRGPGRVVALDGGVDGVAVLLLGGGRRAGLRLLDELPRVALQVRRQGQGAARPVQVVVDGPGEGRLQLARADRAVRRVLRQQGARPVVGRLHLLGCRAETVRGVVPGHPGAEVGPPALERE